MKFWGIELVATEDAWQVLQTDQSIGSAAFNRLEALFRHWYAWPIDLPGRFFLEVVERLYQRNQLATGSFVALGQRINLATVNAPIFLLAARDDELVAPPQLFAAERLVGTPARSLRKAIVPGNHLGLFMGQTVLQDAWPKIVHWIDEPPLLSPSLDLQDPQALLTENCLPPTTVRANY